MLTPSDLGRQCIEKNKVQATGPGLRQAPVAALAKVDKASGKAKGADSEAVSSNRDRVEAAQKVHSGQVHLLLRQEASSVFAAQRTAVVALT